MFGSIKKSYVYLTGTQLLQRPAVILRNNVYAGVGVFVLKLCHDVGKRAVIKQLPQPHNNVGTVGILDVLCFFQGLTAKTCHLHHKNVWGKGYIFTPEGE